MPPYLGPRWPNETAILFKYRSIRKFGTWPKQPILTFSQLIFYLGRLVFVCKGRKALPYGGFCQLVSDFRTASRMKDGFLPVKIPFLSKAPRPGEVS